jgi:hypothetical protein
MTTNARELAELATAYAGGNGLSFRNKIINGNFDIWQRGTSFTADGYGADRWINSRSGSTSTMSRQAFPLGQADVPGEPEYFCRMAVGSVAGAGNFVFLDQRIESVRTFAGQDVTISFWAKADAARSIAVEMTQNFSSPSGGSGIVNGIGVTKVAIGTTWQKVVVKTTVPSISGKTIGTAGNDYLRLVIWLDAGSNFNARTDSLGHQSGTFDIAQVQVEAGSVATPFERRPYGTELALCQRYYYKIEGPGDVTPFGHGFATSTTSARSTIPFMAPMRVAPTALEVTGTAADYSLFYDGAITRNCSAVPNHGASSQYAAQLAFTVSEGLAVGKFVQLRNQSGTAFLAWSAEL